MAEADFNKSTTDRSFFPEKRLIRATFRMLDPVAPARAGRWAAAVWCTPPRARRRWLGDPELPAGARFTVPLPAREPEPERNRGRRPAPKVMAEAWGEGPAVYLLHGWGGWRGQLTAMVAPLVAAGHRVIALDAPGHGESGPGRSGGRRTTLVEMSEALVAVARVAGPPYAVVAHSGGAAATTLALRDGQLDPHRLVFVSPMANPMQYLGLFAEVLGLGERSLPHLTSTLEAMVGRPVGDFHLPAWASASGELPPLLVVHDTTDKKVSYPDGSALVDAWPGARLHTTSGLGHHRILADPAVVASATEFITAQDRVRQQRT